MRTSAEVYSIASLLVCLLQPADSANFRINSPARVRDPDGYICGSPGSNVAAAEITDEAALGLIWKILCSCRSGPEVPVRLFPDGDLIEAAAGPRGLPIGNLTSQLWANYFLDDLQS
jgi:hypothetical protein